MTGRTEPQEMAAIVGAARDGRRSLPDFQSVGIIELRNRRVAARGPERLRVIARQRVNTRWRRQAIACEPLPVRYARA